MAVSLAAPLIIAAVISVGVAAVETIADAPSRQCAPPGAWMEPGGATFNGNALLDRIAQGKVVLLGEQHDRQAHHRWQLDTLRALHARRPDLVLGLEMFPRRVQPALDAWVRGDTSEAEFLRDSDWQTVWRFDPALYMEIFRYAREQRIPMRALNVEASLTRSVRKDGFEAVPPAQREGVTQPAEPSAQYAAWLDRIFGEHGMHGAADPVRQRRFVEAQLVWDRAMAQGIRDALAERPQALVVGLMGSGHLQHGFGVPHQLTDLGVGARAVLLPWDRDADCSELVAGLADAVYGIDEAPARKSGAAI